jgi:hypothetical protein
VSGAGGPWLAPPLGDNELGLVCIDEADIDWCCAGPPALPRGSAFELVPDYIEIPVPNRPTQARRGPPPARPRPAAGAGATTPPLAELRAQCVAAWQRPGSSQQVGCASWRPYKHARASEGF